MPPIPVFDFWAPNIRGVDTVNIKWSHSNDAGRFGESKPDYFLENHFWSLLGSEYKVVQAQLPSLPGVAVQIELKPGAEQDPWNARNSLFPLLLAVAEKEQSYHSDWFLWNRVEIFNTVTNSSITMTV
jgi:hypothetical protein